MSAQPAVLAPSAEFLERLVAAIPPHAAALGWTDAAFNAAAKEAGLTEGEAQLAAPNGISDLIDAFVDAADHRMAEGLALLDLASMRIRDRVRTAVQLRIEAQAPFKDAVRRLGFALASPQRAGTGPRLVWRTADRIWRALGDPSTDFNFYSKRAILSGVLASTYARWLNAPDDDMTEVWNFLDARIDNVMQFEKAKARLKPVGAMAEQALGMVAAWRFGRRPPTPDATVD